MKKKNPLHSYNKKRNFKVTKEPSGKIAKAKSQRLTFVVQEHHARRLHYDFRLEWEGVLLSWAVPKGPSMDPADKRLAVQTEDHPLAYGKFHGTIPEGEYGAGEVFIWDSGTWEPDPEFDFEAGLKKGHIEFVLKGKKLKGAWRLIRTHFKGSGDKQNWLLMKRAETAEKKSPNWPGFIAPQLPKLIDEPRSGKNWLHEMKFDGYRIQAHIRNGIVHFYTRNGLDWSNYFPHLLEAVGKLKVKDAILDGEVVALDAAGRSHFQLLQNTLKSKRDQSLCYYAFDLLFLDGKDLRKKALVERKKLLARILPKKNSFLRFSEHLEEGAEFYRVSCELQLEGIVSKERDAPYRSGRGASWTKVKCASQQEFVIGGYTLPQGGRTGFGALLLGVYQGNELKYVGRVGTGFSRKSLRDIKDKLKALESETSPFDLKAPKGKEIHWVKPELVAQISFANWTDEGILRAPVFLGLREDKSPGDVYREERSEEGNEEANLSSPDKILFAKEKITKQDVANYYRTVAKFMLPAIEDRPLSLVRCPEGGGGHCFFQKHFTGKVPTYFTSFSVPEGHGEGSYISVNAVDGLVGLVQLNAFEIHLWNSRRETLMYPDQLVIDFDPSPELSWKHVVTGAFRLKGILDQLGLKSFVKLTGGKGLHVHVPIAPRYDWDSVKAFSQTLVMELARQYPKDYTTNMAKKLRKGRVFLDYLRNGYGATAVAAYSLRAKAESAVALPVAWSELKRIRSSNQFTLPKALKKIKTRKSDPWRGMEKLKQEIGVLETVTKAA